LSYRACNKKKGMRERVDLMRRLVLSVFITTILDDSGQIH